MNGRLTAGVVAIVSIVCVKAYGEEPSAPSGTAGAESPSIADDASANVARPTISIDSLKQGKLIRYGVTAGVATTLQFEGDMSGVAHSTMAYLVWLPGWYFVRGDVTKAYCATRWMGEPPQEAADAYAQQTANAIKTQKTGKSAVATESEVEELTNGWKLKVPARCGGSWAPGLFVGVPAGFNADRSGTATDFKPLASFGLAWAPISYISLLLGTTISNVVDSDGANSRVFTLTAGLGGNLDILGMLFQ